MLYRSLLTAAAVLLLTTSWALADDARDSRAVELEDAALVRAALEAVGLDESEVKTTHRAVEQELGRIIDVVGAGKPTYGRAKRLHRLLHRDYFERYVEDADGLDRMLTAGEYNCLSATLFHGLVARKLGYPVRVLEYPGHLLLGLQIDGRVVEVETTSRDGFDVLHSGGFDPFSRSSEERERTPFTELGPSAAERTETRHEYLSVSLETAVGFAWLNTAWRALEAGDSLRAAESVLAARDFFGELSSQADDARRLLARAFRAEYESGRFETAHGIAKIEAGMFPRMTTSRDRLLASAVKRVEDACDDDDPSFGAAIIDEVLGIVPPGRDVTRLERRSWPLIAAAAVRLADWELAQRSAERYAAVEPDPVEARRVLSWVESRRSRAAAAPAPVCPGLPEVRQPQPIAP